MRQLIRDCDFERGFTILSQKDHENNQQVASLGEFTYTYNSKPIWKAAQWDSGPCLWKNRVKTDKYTITDDKSKTLRYDPNEKSLFYRLDTSHFYQGNAVKAHDYWPHLLVEQGGFKEEINKRLIVSMDIRLTDYREFPIEGDYVRAAQFLMFMYLRGKESDDFIWFGTQLFDSRADINDDYVGYDGGKEDASGKLIYSIGTKDVYKNSTRSLWVNGVPYPSDEWISISIDAYPYIEKAIAYGARDGYFKTVQKPEDLLFVGLNIGWESIATFDHSMEMKNFKIFTDL